MKYFALFLYLLLSCISASAQLNFQLGEQYFSGVPMKKVVITHDDRTAWALSATGQVYIKRALEANFSIYPYTVGEVVDDLSGYGEPEMYFSVKPKKLILVKNNDKKEIVLPDPEITDIRNIAVVLDDTRLADTTYIDDPFFKDWLAIATDKYLYMVLRGETNVSRRDLFFQPNFEIRDYSITRNGIKGVDFKAKFSTSGRCGGWESDYSVVRTIMTTKYNSVIPDKSPYSDIKCSLFDFQSNLSYEWAIDIWGTDQGLYAKRFGNCEYFGNVIKTLISGKINSVDIIYALGSLKRQTFAIAATDQGFYYTPAKIYPDDIYFTDVGLINFTAFTPLAGIKINNLYSEYVDFVPDENPNHNAQNMCEKAIWLATNEGIKKLYVVFDGAAFQDQILTGFYISKQPASQTANKISLDLCSNDSILVQGGPVFENSDQVFIQWFKDGNPLNNFSGKNAITIVEPGDYEGRYTAVCEGVTMRSPVFSVRVNTAPQITFNYPPAINLCEGQTKELSTLERSEYSYKWFKDGSEMIGETSATYIVSERGSYHVDVSNCAGNFVSSGNVQVNVLTLTKPTLIASKAAYCDGDVPELSISNVSGNRIKWFLNGVEQIVLQNQEIIKPLIQGSYHAVILNANECEKSSEVYVLKINVLPVISVTKNPDRLLCYGERTTLSVPEVSGYTYAWSDGNRTSKTIAANSGAYSVTVTNANGCSSTSLPVSVVVNNQIILNQPPESKLCTFAGEELTLLADAGYKSYIWNGTRTIDNTFKVNSAGEYKLEIEDVAGCKAITTFKVISWCNEIVVHNAFSPNGDGNNDLWRIGGLESDPKATVLIYNRFGTLVLQTTGMNAQWDGKFKGSDAVAGVYYYVITSKQSPRPLKGSVLLVR